MPESAIIDASAMVDLLVGSPVAAAVRRRLRGHELHVPAHFDAEVLAALGRLQRAGELTVRQATPRVQRLSAAPLQRHLLAPLLNGAWKLRHNLRLVDALYVELANRLGVPIVTTDARLAAASRAAELLDTS
ncbi:MAG TPA: type II toxin-antitoxin system VapC family toxin [Acidimicrobiia bacterium]|nr:type II toxin-antitoxin system VapC family toxin [Acidimicrobiia bacterium]